MVFWTIVLAASVAALIYYYYTLSNLRLFKHHGIPYIPAIPVLGNMAPVVFRKKTLTDVTVEAYKHCPEAKYIGLFYFSSPVILVRDLDLIKNICIKNMARFPDHQIFAEEVPDKLFKRSLFSLQGIEWHNMRSVLSPTFTSSKMKLLFKLVQDCTDNFTDHLRQQCSEPKVIEMREAFSRFTNDVIMTSAFGVAVDSMKEPNNECYIMGKRSTNLGGTRTIKLFVMRLFPFLGKLLNIQIFGKETEDFYKHMVKTIVDARETRGIVRPDMLQMMMRVRDHNEKFHLTIDDMTSQAFIFYFGGFENTSAFMTFVAYAVATHRHVHERLQTEVDEVLLKHGNRITYEILQAMPYMDAVINETLRRYPLTTVIDRLCRTSFELPPALPGGKSFIVEPGTAIWIPAHAIHSDPQYWSSPNTFDPDRFSKETREEINLDAYMPFGIGPRSCIGNRLALMETKLVLFYLMAEFDLMPYSATPASLGISRKSLNTTLDDKVFLKIRKRH